MKIYDKKDALILDVEPDDSSYAEDRIHQTKLLTLYYSLPEYVGDPGRGLHRFPEVRATGWKARKNSSATATATFGIHR